MIQKIMELLKGIPEVLLVDIPISIFGAALHDKFRAEGAKRFEDRVYKHKRNELIIVMQSIEDPSCTDNLWRWHQLARDGKLFLGEKKVTEDLLTHLLSQLLPDSWPTDEKKCELAKEEIRDQLWKLNELTDDKFLQRLDMLYNNTLEQWANRAKEIVQEKLVEYRPAIGKITLALQKHRKERGELKWSLIMGLRRVKNQPKKNENSWASFGSSFLSKLPMQKR